MSIYTVESLASSEVATAVREWGAWAIGLLALWLNYKQHRAITDDKPPTVRIIRITNKGEYFALEISAQNHSEKSLLISGFDIFGAGKILWNNETKYDVMGGISGPIDFTRVTSRLWETLQPAGTAATRFSGGAKGRTTLYFTATKPAKKVKIVFRYRFGSEEDKERKLVFRRNLMDA